MRVARLTALTRFAGVAPFGVSLNAGTSGTARSGGSGAAWLERFAEFVSMRAAAGARNLLSSRTDATSGRIPTSLGMTRSVVAALVTKGAILSLPRTVGVADRTMRFPAWTSDELGERRVPQSDWVVTRFGGIRCRDGS
jgi:hypothetical protein